MGSGGNARRESAYARRTSARELVLEEGKRTPVFPLFVVLIIHQTFAFLFTVSSVH